MQKSNPLPGFESAIEAQKDAAAAELGRQLSDRLRAPLGDINARAGRIEQESPLFRETDANPLQTLF